MGFSFSVNSLSALTPAKFDYHYNAEEALRYNINVFANQLAYNSYAAFQDLQDAAISKKNILFLTNPIPLSGIFEQPTKTNTIGDIPGTFFLQTLSGNFLQYTGDTVYTGPQIYNKLLLTITPIESNIIEINTNEGSYLVVDGAYPYTLRTSVSPLAPNQQYRKRFEIDYLNGKLTLKTNTLEGSRYISSGNDGILRAVGLQLNNTVFNSNLFVPNFITKSELSLGFDAKANEVKYYNNLESFTYRNTLDIEDAYVSDTNLLISCATKDVTVSDNATINIAMLRTNYTSTGTYAPSPVPKATNTANTSLSSNDYYLSLEDASTPILVEDLTNIGANNRQGFLINI